MIPALDFNPESFSLTFSQECQFRELQTQLEKMSSAQKDETMLIAFKALCVKDNLLKDMVKQFSLR